MRTASFLTERIHRIVLEKKNQRILFVIGDKCSGAKIQIEQLIVALITRSETRENIGSLQFVFLGRHNN